MNKPVATVITALKPLSEAGFPWPPKCETCGRFMPWPADDEIVWEEFGKPKDQ